jgi:hypothetical protein
MFTRRRTASVLVALVLALAPVAACGGRGSGPQAESPPPSASPSQSVADTPTTPPTTQPSTSPSTGSTGRILSSRLAYQWNWPNDAARPGSVRHDQHVPPVPALVAIGVGDHPSDPGERAFNRMTFTFDTGFPSYRFAFANKLYADATGAQVPLAGRGVLVVRFEVAQAHSADGTRSTVTSKPSANIGYRRIVSYAQAGDYEGVLTYGIGITWPNAHSNPQIAVRAYEVERVTSSGQHHYVVAIDVDAR